MKLLLVLLAWGASQLFPPEVTAASLGRLSRQWRDLWLTRDLGSYFVGVGLIVGVPLVVFAAVLYGFHGFWRHLLAGPLTMAIVFWALLDRYAPGAEQRFREDWLARSWPVDGEPDLIPPEASLALELGNARRLLLGERLSELFSPLLWFLLLGPLALAAYYLLRITGELAEVQPAGYVAKRWQDWADWLPARVLALSFALGGNFDTTWKYLNEKLRDPALPTLDLLDGAAEAAHPAEVTVSEEVAPGAALVLALGEVEAMLRRAGIIWVVLLALHTLLP